VDELTPFTELTLSAELSLFTELKPPVPEAGPIQARARARVVDGLRANRSRGRRFALRAGLVSGQRGRRRLALGLSAVAVAACAATVVPSVLLGGHTSTLVTPAYAVTRGSDGTVSVTIYDIANGSDAANLQRALRAEGVPALLWAGGISKPPAPEPICRPRTSDVEPQKVQEAVVRTEFNGHLFGPGDGAIVVLPAHLTPAERASYKKDPGLRFIIHPSAMPSGSVLYIWRLLNPGPAGQPLQQEIGTPLVLKHDRLSCRSGR
jgi:hypothetical protein